MQGPPGVGKTLGPTGASNSNFRVDRLQFVACVVDSHLPIDAALLGIDIAGPGGYFGRQKLDAANSSSTDALARNAA